MSEPAEPLPAPAPDLERRWPLRVAPLTFVAAMLSLIVVSVAVFTTTSLVGIDTSTVEDQEWLVGIPMGVLWVVAAIAVPWLLLGPQLPADFGLRQVPLWRTVGKLLLLLVLFGLLSQLYTSAAGVSPDDNERLQNSPFGDGVFQDLLLLVLFVVTAPLAEELLFRGAIYRGLRDGLWGARALRVGLGAAISGVIFGVLHVSGGQDAFIPVLILFGVILALAYEWTGSLYPPILLHAGNNALAVSTTAEPSADWFPIAFAVAPLVTLLVAVGLARILAHLHRTADASVTPSPLPPPIDRPDGV